MKFRGQLQVKELINFMRKKDFLNLIKKHAVTDFNHFKKLEVFLKKKIHSFLKAKRYMKNKNKIINKNILKNYIIR